MTRILDLSLYGQSERHKYEPRSMRAKGVALEGHNERVEAHCQRVAADYEFMREHGIDPNRRGSALRFDKLKRKSQKG